MDTWKKWWPEGLSFLLLVGGLLLKRYLPVWGSHAALSLLWFVVAYLPVAWPVFRDAAKAFAKRDFFNEFVLMIIASIGAFFIGEYPEAVAVMLFYAIGEKLQEGAVEKSRRNIRELLEAHPDKVRVLRNGEYVETRPEEVEPGEVVEVAVGEKICLDGLLLDDSASLDSAALTGESLPRFLQKGQEIPAGCIVLDHRIRLEVLRPYASSVLAKMARMVEEAAKRKAPTEMFLRRIARIYTPVVMGLAVLVLAVPALVSLSGSYVYDFSTWLYRALVFLVISCPCALVVSIPLTYFAGIGMASRRGILFKGGNGLDAALNVDSVVFDKTGTLTQGNFSVCRVFVAEGEDRLAMLSALASVESASRHPLASAIVEHARKEQLPLMPVDGVEEKAGWGVRAEFGKIGKEVRNEGKMQGTGTVFRQVVAGSAAWLQACGIEVPEKEMLSAQTVVFCAVDGRFAGGVELADLPKTEAVQAIRDLKDMGIRPLAVLSGDHARVVEALASHLGIEKAYGGLLPEDKVVYLQEFSREGHHVAFVGDGINDSPVLASSSLGIAMGGVGSDAAIETADVVLQTDRLDALPMVFRVARRTRRTVWQNVVLAFGIKILVMVLGLFDIASLWMAVFADSGVALLAVLNSVRGVWMGKGRKG